MPLFTELTDFEIENVNTAALMRFILRLLALKTNCSLCDVPTSRIQSRYTRTLADLPISGTQLQLHLLVRRFYCDNPACLRCIFAERFPTLTQPYVQRTNWLSQTLRQVGLALGGEASAALAQKLGMVTSPDTLLRLVRVNALNPGTSQAKITKIGIDDWSWKRGMRFGTIIVDLDSHQVIDLLADRSRETVAKWLRNHPQIEVISRDRATEYALAASQAAPQAIQVADRFHVVRNLAEQVELLLARLRREWRPKLGKDTQLALAKTKQAPSKTLPHPQNWKVEPSRQTERKRLARRDQRLERYKQVVQLREAGLLQREIVERTGLAEKTIRNWLKAPAFPEAGPYPKRRSVFDPYAAYVLKRWQEGQHDGEKLWEEITVQGFKGTSRTVRRYLRQLRDEKRQPLILPPASALEGIKVEQAVWWFIRQPDKLKKVEAYNLGLLRQASPSLDEIYRLVQTFMRMVEQLKGEQLEEWLSEVKQCPYVELQSFARGIEKYKVAVKAGLSLPYSNGVVEGHNNRLKLIKRSGYGRAKLDLLKQRVLAAA